MNMLSLLLLLSSENKPFEDCGAAAGHGLEVHGKDY